MYRDLWISPWPATAAAGWQLMEAPLPSCVTHGPARHAPGLVAGGRLVLRRNAGLVAGRQPAPAAAAHPRRPVRAHLALRARQRADRAAGVARGAIGAADARAGRQCSDCAAGCPDPPGCARPRLQMGAARPACESAGVQPACGAASSPCHREVQIRRSCWGSQVSWTLGSAALAGCPRHGVNVRVRRQPAKAGAAWQRGRGVAGGHGRPDRAHAAGAPGQRADRAARGLQLPEGASPGTGCAPRCRAAACQP